MSNGIRMANICDRIMFMDNVRLTKTIIFSIPCLNAFNSIWGPTLYIYREEADKSLSIDHECEFNEKLK